MRELLGAFVSVFLAIALCACSDSLAGAEAGEASVRLYDMTGRLVYSHALNTQTFVISTQGLSQGVYTLVTLSNGKQQVDRVVVE